MSSPSAIDPEIYRKSGSIEKHLEGVKKQYDTKEKLDFYAEVMGDGTANIHFGKKYQFLLTCTSCRSSAGFVIDFVMCMLCKNALSLFSLKL